MLHKEESVQGIEIPVCCMHEVFNKSSHILWVDALFQTSRIIMKINKWKMITLMNEGGS